MKDSIRKFNVALTYLQSQAQNRPELAARIAELYARRPHDQARKS